MSGSLHSIPETVFTKIAAVVGATDPDGLEVINGGSINRSYRLQTSGGDAFLLKTNSSAALSMFTAEQEALEELRRAAVIRVPEPILSGVGDDCAFLLLEFIEFGHKTPGASAACGHALADLHRIIQPGFGWYRDNTIGSTPQQNRRTEDWVTFLRDRRLGFQLQLAAENGLDATVLKDGDRLLDKLPEFFTNYQPAASLLHGDLWGGNWAATFAEVPVIYDPALYYGDREADIAMTRLFGGFGPEFYAAYNESWPLDAGFRRRTDLYNLYHVLNHFNLFGGGYREQVAELLNKLLR